MRAPLPLLLFALLIAAFSSPPASAAISVGATTFPVYLVASNVAKGGGVELELLISPALGCPHDYQLTPSEMKKLSRMGAVIKNGQGLEDFLDRALSRAGGAVKVIDASSGVVDLLSEVEEGVKRVNPHFFASPRLNGLMALAIAKGLGEVDPANARLYAANAAAYREACDRLGAEFAALGAKLKGRAVVTHHSALDYMVRDLGLAVAGVIESHGGREPGAAELRALVREARKANAAAVFVEPQYPKGAGGVVARELGIPIAQLDPVASGPANAPADYYFTAMRRNLAVAEGTLVPR